MPAKEKKNASSIGNKLIQEWNEWESLPDPDVDINEVLKMDYKSECQELLNKLKESKKELSNDQYFNILTFQARLTLYLYIKNVDIPELILKLHNLRISCIMRVNSSEISKILSSISSFFEQIEKKPLPPSPSPSRRFNTQSKIRETPKREEVKPTNQNKKSNTNENIDNNDDKNNIFIFNDQKSSFPSSKKLNNKFSKQPKQQNYNYKPTVNPFQYLSNNEDIYENESTNISSANSNIFEKENSLEKEYNRPHSTDIPNHHNDLLNLLNVDNGITDPKYTKKIFDKIKDIYKSDTTNKVWKKECDYFRNREMIPLQHIIFLKDLLINKNGLS